MFPHAPFGPTGDPPPLVGRERELVVLRDAFAAALAGRGSLVLISGEAGIGKTTLAETLLTEATVQGAAALVGRCYDLAETPPYGPWVELFARGARAGALPPFPLGADDVGEAGPASQQALFARARAALEHAARPLVLLLEDLHWADPASLDLLRSLGRDLDTLPLLLIGTYRADEVARRHPLYQLLPTLVREARATRLELHPLDRDGVRDLVARYHLSPADTARLVAYLGDRAEGNPFFTGELLRALEEAGALRPPAAQETRSQSSPSASGGVVGILADLTAVSVPLLLRQIVDARLDRLGAKARGLLLAAAILGQEVPLDLWVAVAGVDDAHLLDLIDLAAEARVLEPTDEGARFAHALIRQTLYESMLPIRRRGLHRRAADALLASADPDPDAVAFHLQRAGDPRAAGWLIRAGERAWAAYAWLTAAERYESALAIMDASGTAARERALVLLTLAQFWRYADRHRGIGYLEEAEQLASAAGDATLLAAARFDRAHLSMLAQDARATAERTAGLAAMAAALPILEALPPAERAQLPALLLQRVGGEELYHRGALLYWLVIVGRLAEAQALATPMIARGPGATARGLAATGMLHFYLGQPDIAERDLADAEAAFRAAGQLMEVQYRLDDRLTVAWAYFPDQPGLWQHLLEAIDEVARRAARAGTGLPNPALLRLLMVRGAWSQARRLASEHAEGEWLSAIVARHQGEDAVVWKAIRQSLPQGWATEPGRAGLLTMLELQPVAVGLALDAGDLPAAAAWLGAHDRWLTWSGSVWGRAEGQLGRAAYHRATGDLALARRHAAQALAHATEPRQPIALLAAHRLLGELDTAMGAHVDAAAHLADALALADACSAPYERALTLLALAELRAATGERDVAKAIADEARAILGPLGARPAIARADALAARLASTPEPVPNATLAFGLTAREAEVLHLLAEGLSDAQIADRLFLSPYTVKAHLRSIYGKLAVPSRTAAARLAREHGLA